MTNIFSKIYNQIQNRRVFRSIRTTLLYLTNHYLDCKEALSLDSLSQNEIEIYRSSRNNLSTAIEILILSAAKDGYYFYVQKSETELFVDWNELLEEINEET